MNHPLVSICLPTYNYAYYLPQAIESCLRQTYSEIELIVVDDASPDETCEVVKRFDDSRLKFFLNPERLGLTGNWNKTISLAGGEIVKFIFADDYLALNGVAKFVEAFEQNDAELVFCASQVVDAKGELLPVHRPYMNSDYLLGRVEFRRCLKRSNYIGSPSAVALKAAALKRVGGFSNIGFYADLDMWMRVLLTANAYYIDEPLAYVRQHEGSETSRLIRTAEAENETLLFFQTWLERAHSQIKLTDAEMLDLVRGYEDAAVTQVLNTVKRGAYGESWCNFIAGMEYARLPSYLVKAFWRGVRQLAT